MKAHKLMVALAGALAVQIGQAADLTISVAEGVTQDFYTALAANGYQKSDLKGQRIVKTGLGVLVSTNDLTSKSGSYFSKVLVKEGVFAVRSDNDFGYNPMAENAIIVNSGATIRLNGSGFQIINRCLTLAGSGAQGEGGAVVCNGYGESNYAQYTLAADTTFRSNYAADYALCFQMGQFSHVQTFVNLAGHDLTLTAKGTGSRYGYRLVSKFRLNGSGRVVVDGTYLGQGGGIVENCTTDDGYATLVLKNGATFRPRSQDIVSFFDAIDAEADTTIAAGEDGTAAFAMSIGDILGAPTATSLTSLTIKDSMTVRVADLKNGKRLSVDGELIFDGTIPLTIVGDPSELQLVDNRIKIAVSDAGVTGLPTLTSARLSRHWSVAASSDGRSVELVYDPSLPAGTIDVRTWGILPGADNAAANTAAFNDTLAALETANPVLYFAEGDYYFSGSLLIARDNVILSGEGQDAKLHLASGSSATSLIRITGNNDTVTQIAIADTTGPGVFVSGASNAVVTNAFFTGVTGTYPVEAENSTLTLVRDNRFLDGATYTALAHHTGGTQATGSEPQLQYESHAVGEIRITVDVGESETMAEAFAKCGHASMTKWHIRKVGAGTLVGSGTSDFLGLTIAEGTYEASSNGCFGQAAAGDGDKTFVLDGGTLRITGSSGRCIANRIIYLTGSGAPGQGGALVWAGGCYNWYAQYHLSGDAVIAAAYADGLANAFKSDDVGHPTVLTLNGYDVKLVSTGSGRGFQLADVFKLVGSGSVTVDGTTLCQTTATFTPMKTDGATVALRLRNGATFSTPTVDSLSFFTDVECDSASSVAGTGTAFDWAVTSWTGCGTVGAGISSLTIANAMTVRAADLNADNALSVAGNLAFGDFAALSIENAASLTSGDTGRRTVFATEASLSGCPILKPAKASRNWKVETQAQSAELVYSPSKPTGAIDVCADWGIAEGAENAAANTLAFNDGVAALTGAAVLFVPKGTYAFAEPLVVGKSGVTLLGDAEESVFKAADGFTGTTLLTVSGANVNVSGLTLEGASGPAVTAANTTALVVTNNSYRAIGGVIADVDGTYPVSVVNGTGTLVRDNLVLDGTKYTEAVYLNGGTRDASGEPLASQVRIRVDGGEELGLAAAFARTGRASYPQNSRLVKTGDGTLLGSTGYAPFDGLIKGITVEKGVYKVTADNFGIHDYGIIDQIKIKSGATLVLACTGNNINNRICYLEGAGAPGMGGALVLAAGGKCSYAQYKLTGDATIYAAGGSSYAQCFDPLLSGKYIPSTIDLDAHTLTLKSSSTVSGYSLARNLQIQSVGTILVSETKLVQSTDAVVAYGSKRARLVLRNGAQFMPRTQDILDNFSAIDADATSSVVGGDGGAADFAMTLGGWAGAGTVSSGFTSLTVTNSFEVYAADLLAGQYAAMACPVILAPTAKLRVTDPDGLFAALPKQSEHYVCAESSVSFAGVPRKDASSDFRRWSASIEGGTKLCIDTYIGFAVIFR